MTLVELYAGMSAVSWASFGAVPPVKYQGGKRAYAGQILAHLGVTEPPSRVVLVEADPYVADALRVVWTPEERAGAIERILSWEAPEEEQRGRWLGWRDEAHTDGWAGVDWRERGARWLWMRPRTVPMPRPPLCARGNWSQQKHSKNGKNNWRLDAPARNLAALPESARAEVVCGLAEDLAPIPGAVAYLDPPYPGTKGYSGTKTPDYTEIARLAMRWADAGARVGVSCSVALSLEARALEYRAERGRNLGGTREYLSMFRRA